MKRLFPTAGLFSVLLLLTYAFFWNSSANAQRGQGRNMPHGPDQQLWQAAFDGDLAGVKSALEQGADVNVKGRGGFSALLAACRNGHLPVVEYLVDHGAHVNQRDNMRDKTPLTAAAFQGHHEIVKYLLEHGAEINDQ